MAKTAAPPDPALLQVRLESGRTTEDELKTLRSLARWLDSRFEIAGVKFGADAIVGLVPVAGDVITLVTGLLALWSALRLRLPWHVAPRIVLNLVTDAGFGAVPVLGDLFDFFFRSHKRNFQLVEHHVLERAAQRLKRGAA